MNEQIEALRERLREFYEASADLDASGGLTRSAEWQSKLHELQSDAIEVWANTQDNTDARCWLDSFLRTLERLLGLEVEVYWGGMPGAIEFFFGREQETHDLNSWLTDAGTRIIQCVGAGGFGKTQLINHWLKALEAPDRERPRWSGLRAVFCWCFYSDARISVPVDEFLSEATRFFQKVTNNSSPPPSRDERAQYLARLVGSGKYLVVLDGLEALQKRPRTTEEEEADGESELKPGAFRRKGRLMGEFLRAFAAEQQGLVVITSRQPVANIESLPTNKKIPVSGLEKEEGVQILKRIGVQGSPEDLTRIVIEFAGHPLSLVLAAQALAWYHNGLASQWQQVQLAEGRIAIDDDSNDQMLVRSYRKWLRTGPEMQLLSLVGFFSKRLIPRADLEIVLGCTELSPILHELREAIASSDFLGEIDWSKLFKVFAVLKDNSLLLHRTQSDQKAGDYELVVEVYDAHPILRDYFREELRSLEGGEYWRAGQRALFEHYADNIADEEPQTLQDMLALYEAIGYACEGRMYREAFDLYWDRIHRNAHTTRPLWYAINQCGLYSADLGALGWFYERPWEKMHPAVYEQLGDDINWVRVAVTLSLKALGLASEAGHPLNAALSSFQAQNEHMWASAMLAGEECERQLVRGKFDEALKKGYEALEYAEKSGDAGQLVSKQTRLGDVYLQKGDWTNARGHFLAAVAKHQERIDEQYWTPGPLGGRSGFLYGDFRLTIAEIVLEKWVGEGSDPENLLPTPEQAMQDIAAVLQEGETYARDSDHAPSLQEKALHAFLAAKAQLVQIVAGPSPWNTERLQIVRQHIEDLYNNFASYARGELPRLLVMQSQVYRHLRDAGVTRIDEADPLFLAMACVDEADDVADYGELKLYQADIALERGKIFFAQAKHLDAVFASQYDSLKRAKASCDNARVLIEEMGYHKRRKELENLECEIVKFKSVNRLEGV